MAKRDPACAEASGKKRKRRAPPSAQEEDAGPSQEPEVAQKSPRPDSIWINLDFILSLQHKDVPINRKMELAFNYVGSGCCGQNQGRTPVQFSRVVCFLSDWVQPLLISSDQGKDKSSSSSDACLDYRPWVVLKFCLENSAPSVSQNLLRPITRVLVHVVSMLERDDDAVAGEDSAGFYGAFSQCLSLVFSSHGRTFNVAGVELWVSCAVAAVGLVLKIFLNGSVCNRDVLLRLSLLLLEQFASFLRFHPSPKNIFRSFVDRLLEPLLELLVLLKLRAGDGNCGEHAGSLLTVVEDILSNGLFHPVHISGFLSPRSSNAKTEVQELKSFNESYHRHFFVKFQKIVMEKKVGVMGGFGLLFHLFVTIARKKRGAFAPSKVINKLEKDNMVSEKENGTSKPLFEVFIQFMEPLVLECKRFIEMEFSGSGEPWESKLLEIHCTLLTFNDILKSFMHEKIYERTQDSPEGAHCTFLKKIYDVVVGISQKMYLLWLSIPNVREVGSPKMLLLIAKELNSSIGYFLKIEYTVVGDDLAGIWFMMLCYLSVHLSTEMQAAFLTNEILSAGCLMINVYSELRQASRPIFSLCEAVRFFRFSDDGGESGRSTFFPFRHLSSDACMKAVMTLLCSQELKSSISNAIKSIPEGQASGCVQRLKSDFTESLEWIRTSFMKIDGAYNPNLLLEVGLFGSLSELYSTVLESLTVTASNSISIGNSINDLITTIRQVFSSFVQNQSNNFDDFYISFTGRKLANCVMPDSRGLLDTFWIFVVFFRLYVSCRSVYLQTIGLMPPDSSKKASSSVGNLFSASSGMDWEGVADWTDGGYFSWMVKPSISLLVMIQFVSKTFLTENITACAPLVFVLHVMALQRLTDLNRQVRSFEYLLKRDVRLAQVQLMDGTEHSHYKQNKKWKRLLKSTRQEAADLTNFMTQYLRLLILNGRLENFQVEKAGEGSKTLSATEDAWDMVVCSLNDRSLPIAIWWLLCQNIDIWCVHASRRGLKDFSSLLVHHAICCVRSCSGDTLVHKRWEQPSRKKVKIRQISIDLLKNMVFYEQPVLLRHFTSRLSRLLKKSILPAVSYAFGTNVDLTSLPDWSEILSTLDNVPFPSMGVNCASNSFAQILLHSVSSNSIHPEDCRGKNLFPPTKLEVGMCQTLLILLCKLPEVHANLRPFSVIVAYILNLERFAVYMLVSCYSEFSLFQYDLLSLFVSCRRTLRCLLRASLEDNREPKESSDLGTLFGSPSSIQWLLKSACRVVGLPHAHFGDEQHSNKVSKMFFMLMDHTSYLFLTLSEVQMNAVLHFVLTGGKLHLEHPMHDVPTEKSTLSEVEVISNSSGDLGAWKSLKVVASILEKETRVSLLALRSMGNMGQDTGDIAVNWNNLSNTLSCFQGFVWGLVSAVSTTDGKHSNENVSNLIFACILELDNYVAVFEEFVVCFLKLSLLDDHWTEDLSATFRSHILDGAKNLSHFDFPVSRVGILGDESKTTTRICHMIEAAGAANCLTSNPDDDSELHHLRLSVLRKVLKGENPDVGFSIRQLFMSTAAILKLRHILSSLKATKSGNGCNYLLSSSTSILVATSDFILSEMTDFVRISQHSDILCIDGVLKYLEVLGGCFSVTKSVLSKNMFSKMINIHLRAIGKCICLQGKGATLASHETGSYTKMLESELREGDNYMHSVEDWENKLNELKARIRMSFKELIRRPLQSDLVLVVQALERVLVGVRQDWNMVYEVSTGDKDGGKVSAIVAAGIDCFDLVFDSFSGRKLLGIIRGCIQNLVGSLFNIILHLQAPSIFYREMLSSNKNNSDPDPGSIILMCVEVLTNVARKHSRLKTDACNVGQSLHVPASLFRHFYQVRTFQVSGRECISKKSIYHLIVDHRFCVDLYAACCRLLCTILRHQTSETARCISLLEDSVKVLLTCLESVDADPTSQKGYFALAVQEAAKCASFLRRVYEEVWQQKSIFGTYSSHFLADYICVYSGYGPLRTGIKREVDEALRQGVYALIDMCSPEDFQKLHTVLGEGPCRRTLSTLRHDYQLNFQYQGKI